LDDDTQTGAGLKELTTLIDLVEDFRVHPEAVAVMALDQSGSVVTHTYGDLADRIYTLANKLTRRGFSDGAMILLWAPNSVEWVIAYFAIIVSGNVVIPLDDQISAAGSDAVLRHSCPACVFTTTRHLPTLEALDAVAGVPRFLLDRDGNDVPGPSGSTGPDAAALVPDLTPDQLASLLYTSGTTGPPKAVPLTHANLMSNVRSLVAAELVSAEDRVLVPLPLHHAYAATVGMLSVLARGATLIMPRGISGPELTTAATLAGATVLLGVPRLYAALKDSIDAGIRSSSFVVRALYPVLLRASIVLKRRLGIRAGRLLFRGIRERVGADLRLLASGGARLEPELAWTLEGLGWEVLTGYGLTETSPVVTFNRPDRKRLGSQGVALAGVEIDVEKTPGESYGEILVKGPNVFAGYWKNDAATRAAFTADGWFRTGDLGFLDVDGYLHIVGRSKEIIVLADGKNVSPEDVERLYETSPLIREVAVLEKSGTLVALVVPEEEEIRRYGALRAEDQLREEMQKAMLSIPAYQRIAEYRVIREALPRTRLAKLQRHLLPEMFEEAMGAEAAPATAEFSDADRQLLQSSVVNAAWQWLQKRFADSSITLDSSPQLDLGIDSLAWITITGEIERELGIVLSTEALSRVLTLRDLLRAIETASRDTRAKASVDLERRHAERFLRDPGPLLRMFGGFVLGLNRILMRGCFRLRIEGLERLPSEGPFVIAPNHNSYLDPLAVGAALPRHLLSNTCWAGWARKMHKGPIFRAVSLATHVFPVDPNLDPGSGIRLGTQALEDGRVLVWFPEGGRSFDGAIQPFQRGIGVLLRQNDVETVPVGIHGSFEAWPRARAFPRLRRITIEFGWPKAVDELLAEGQGDDAPARISDGLERCVKDLLVNHREV
jgi:long-chain acyl-CoA synthetase